MTVVFCHGLEGSPHGKKAQALRAGGLDVVAPDFTGMNLAARVTTLLPVLAAHPDCTLVGSSYGGLTALCGAILHSQAGGKLRGLVLAAPALFRAEPPADALGLAPPCPTLVIHGLRDALIPAALVESWAAEHPQVRLQLVDDEHVLAASLALIVAAARELEFAVTPA